MREPWVQISILFAETISSHTLHVSNPTSPQVCVKHLSPLPNISTLAILISPENPPKTLKMGSPKWISRNYPDRGFLWKFFRNPEFPGISRPIPISDFGVPIFSVLGGKWSWYVGQRWNISNFYPIWLSHLNVAFLRVYAVSLPLFFVSSCSSSSSYSAAYSSSFVQENPIDPWPRYFWKVSRYTSLFYRDILAKECPPLGRQYHIHHQFVSRYASHLYRDTFSEVLGSGVVGNLPHFVREERTWAIAI